MKNTKDKVVEYCFWDEGLMVGKYSESVKQTILKESVNAYGVPYSGDNASGKFHAKGKFGIIEFDFFWNVMTEKERIVH